MKQSRIFTRTLLATAVALTGQQAYAAGFQLNAQSATGLGRAFAGDAVIADNASSMARNPATMALFDAPELSLGFETITTDISISNFSGIPYSDYDDVGGTAVAPNIHFIMPVNDKFAWGINAYSNFGTSTDFSGSDELNNSLFGGETDIFSINLGLAGSYRINQQWSVGAGLDIIYGAGTLRRGANEIKASTAAELAASGMFTAEEIAGIVGTIPSQAINVDNATGFGVGFNLGAVYELNDNNRFGLSYRYSPDIEAEDDNDQKITLPLPDMVEFSGYHLIQDTKFAAHYSVQWIEWSEFDKVTFENLNQGVLTGEYEKAYGWQDGWRLAVGGTYYLNNSFTLRAGYMHDTSAQDELTSISVPDSDRNWISAGATWHIDDKSNIDFGFTYLIGQDADVTELDPLTNEPVLTATTRADAILLGLQYSRSF